MSDESHKKVLADTNNYDPSKKTKIIIHGWKNTFKSNVGQKLKNSYLEKDDLNVFGKQKNGNSDFNLCEIYV